MSKKSFRGIARKLKKKQNNLPILAVVIICAAIILKITGSGGGEVETISKASLEKVIEISDLSTLDYTYNAITSVPTEDNKKIKYYVSYKGTVTVGIDFSKINISEDTDKKLINIKLPEPEIQTVSVDMGSLDFIFNDDKYETETVTQEAYKACVSDLTESAENEPTLQSMAKYNSIAAIKALITPWVNQIAKAYTVEVI